MIKLRDAAIADGLPDVVAKEAWCIALGYAVQRQMRKILYYADLAHTYSAIDLLSDGLLDILAAELRTPQYLESYPVETKRNMVKGTLAYYATAGTKAALEAVCRDIFGSAEALEWYEYGGKPGYFRIQTDNPNTTDENVRDFIKVAEGVKRLSAWLDGIELVLTARQEIFAGSILHIGTTHRFSFAV